MLTTRGMKEKDMKEVASFIAKAVKSVDDEAKLKAIKNDVLHFCKNFQFYK